jgi:uncharacterized membrane protein YjjP (DUF1212 family)
MNWYPLLVFLHVLGAVSMFAAWGVEAVLLQRLRRTVTIDEARTSAHHLRKYGRMAPVAMLAVLATGMAMMTQWGPQPWMSAAFGALIVIGVIGGVTGRRMRPRIAAALAGEQGGAPTGIAATAGSLAVSLQLRVAIGVGIIGLMTMKPGAQGSLLILGVATVTGLLVAVRETWRHGASRERQPAERALRS